MKLARGLGVTQKTAWFIAHRLRQAWKSRGWIFAGPVEADETFVGGKAKNMDAWKKALLGPGGYEKVAVAGIKDQATGKVKAKVVGNWSATWTVRP